jgi:hypothetical protein
MSIWSWFPVVVSPKARNDHRLPSAIPPGLERWELVYAKPLSLDVWQVIFPVTMREG